MFTTCKLNASENVSAAVDCVYGDCLIFSSTEIISVLARMPYLSYIECCKSVVFGLKDPP